MHRFKESQTLQNCHVGSPDALQTRPQYCNERKSSKEPNIFT